MRVKKEIARKKVLLRFYEESYGDDTCLANFILTENFY